MADINIPDRPSVRLTRQVRAGEFAPVDQLVYDAADISVDQRSLDSATRLMKLIVLPTKYAV